MKPARYLIVGLLCSCLAACAGSPHMDRVQRTGAQARSRPGAAQVVAYVKALRAAHREHAFDKQPTRSQKPAHTLRRTSQRLAMWMSSTTSSRSAKRT